MPISRRTLLSAGLAIVAAPSAVLALAERGARAASTSRDNLRRFSKSDYSYCDARVLAHFWGADVADAKARIGAKLGAKQLATVDSTLAKARKAAMPVATQVCPHYESAFSYEDIEALAAMWQQDVYEVKTRVAQKLVAGHENGLRHQVKAAHQQLPSKPGRDAHIKLYYDAGYTYCDANVLGAYWGKDTIETKSVVGQKLRTGGNGAYLERKFAAARARAMPKAASVCPYYDNGFSYSDMDNLSALWGKNIDETKASASKKLVAGQSSLLQAEVSRAKRALPTPVPAKKIRVPKTRR